MHIGLFTTRELSTMVWLVFIFILVLFNKKMRMHVVNLIGMIFGKQLRKIWTIIIIYVVGITLLLSILPGWKNIYIKDVLVWFFSSGLFICMNSVSAEADDKYIVYTIKDKLKITMLSEFILSTFTFPLVVELLLLPFMTLLILLKTFSECKREYKDISSFIDFLVGILSFWIICGTICVGMNEYRSLNGIDTFVGFFIPILYLMAVVPLMFGLEIFSKYQSLFSRMSSKQKDDKKIKRMQRIAVVKECKCSVKMISAFRCNYMPRMYKNMSAEEFDSLIQEFRYNSI